MRLLSPYPDHHVLCRVGGTSLEPGQIAGILDGDGAFTLLRRRSASGIRIRPQIALAMRDDDPLPLAVWASVKARRGAAMGVMLRSNTYRRHEWRVDRLDEVVELSNWLSRHPLLSPRGYRQLSIVREVALILLTARVPGGGTRRLPLADQARLLELRELIPARGQDVTRMPPSPVAALASPEHRGWVLAGLIAAEGSFSLRNEHSKLAPAFSLSQRIDNIALLEMYRDQLGIGDIRLRPARSPRAGQMAIWTISRLGDCGTLAEALRDYPVPVASPKAAQVDVWIEALDQRRRLTAERPRQRVAMSPILVDLAERLRAAKRYAGPRLLCECGQG
jgi:hypothetical protein